MATYITIEESDIEIFNEMIDTQCIGGECRVVASNAYYNGKCTMYYALLEGFVQEQDDPINQIVNYLEQIKLNTDRIL